MKRTQKLFKISSVLVVLSLLLTAAACDPPTPTRQVTLKIWKPFVETETFQPLMSAYQEKHPNVQFEYVKKNIDTYEEDLLNALASGDGPDIFSVNNTWVPKYLDKIQPAPEKLYTIKEYKDTFVDVMNHDLIIDNKIYGTALWVDSLGLYYNKDLMGTAGIATPPKTWAELSQDVRKITQQEADGYFNRSGVAMGTYSNINRAVDIVYLLMLQAGVIPWSADGQFPQFAGTINRNGTQAKPGTEALEFYTSFSNPASPNYTWNEESDYSIDAFANGRAAFLYGYAYTRSIINSKAPNLNYDVAPVPQYDLKNAAVNYSNYFAEVVSKQSKDFDYAWDFLKFATSKPMLDAYYANDKEPSSRRDLIELQTQDLEIGVFAHANLTGKSFYKADEKRFDGIFEEMIENIVLRGQKIDQAISKAQSQASTLTKTSQ